MVHAASPLENGLSSAELFMNRGVKTTLPIARSQLKPMIENRAEFQRKEENYKQTTITKVKGYHINYGNSSFKTNL